MDRETTYRILAEGQTACNDTWKTGLNNNDLIIGPSGAGKTRGYVLPNILQCNESIIVADSKNSLRQKTEKVLRLEGYKIISLDFTDCHASDGYNPLDYIRYDETRVKYCEQDIMTIAACLVPVKTKHDPFWELSARLILEALIAYVLECLPEEEHTLCSVAVLFRAMDEKYFSRLFYELGELNPDSFAYIRYEMFKSVVQAEKTYACIQAFLAEKLAVYTFEGTQELLQKTDRIRIEDVGKEKTAVFVGVSDTDRALDELATLFFTQALHVLCSSADRNYPDNRLAVPVRLMMDDFAANVSIPDFDKIISVIRSRDVWVSIILQSISQLESIYGHAAAMTIINNCDTCLYLGGQDVETAGYIGIKANKTANTILNMPLDRAWLFRRGQEPLKVRKYPVESHSRYQQMT